MNIEQWGRISKQSGFSLISLMIASLIGVIITGAAIQMYLGSSQTFQARQAVSAAGENNRFALDDIARTIVMTGRGMSGDNDNNYKRAHGKQQSVWGAGNVDGGINGSDEIVFMLALGKNCTGGDIVDESNNNNWEDVNGDGNKTLIGIVTSIRYYIAIDGNNISNLMCQVGGDTPEPLVAGIEMIKVLYGLDTDFDNAANYYVTSTKLTELGNANPSEPDPWNSIVSIRIGIISSSAEFNIPDSRQLPGSPATINVLGGSYTPADNGRAYHASTATVSLRNLGFQ